MLQEAKMADEHPKHVLMRASLHQAVEDDEGIRAFARSPKAENDRKALEESKAFANAASPEAVLGADWDNGSVRQ